MIRKEGRSREREARVGSEGGKEREREIIRNESIANWR